MRLYLERMTAVQPWDYFCLYPETTEGLETLSTGKYPLLPILVSLELSHHLSGAVLWLVAWLPSLSVILGIDTALEHKWRWLISCGIWQLLDTGLWSVTEGFHVPMPGCTLTKKTLIFDQKCLNKLVWFGSRDMSELGHYFLMLLCHLGERSWKLSARHHFLLMLPV